jgi:hypothetical protein
VGGLQVASREYWFFLYVWLIVTILIAVLLRKLLVCQGPISRD